MENRQAGCLQFGAIARGVAGGCGHEPDSLVDDELHNGWVTHVGQGDVDPERLVGQLAHLADFTANRVQFSG
ncbi:hypothetical protein [Cupriavidus sp. D39]|uniref:hypothetical protein n=1 Tax=Cupriavidus sp. D39 TaxID=2997877 RepID=UPI002270A1B1|nr:hypothetical protein [Cupriavidus sp. D39]MCY0854721.1 hypothetical protein [Cupriavidus sp. D39]